MTTEPPPVGPQRLDALRSRMAAAGWDAVVVPTADPHMSEYPPDYFAGRAWLSGFTGSAGTLVVTAHAAALWTDGRYYIQAAMELNGSGIELKRAAEPGCPTVETWLLEALPDGGQVACDGRMLAVERAAAMRKAFRDRNLELAVTRDPLNGVWETRPALPRDAAFLLGDAYAGETVATKLSRVRETMRELEADAYVVSRLDAVAWLLNIRGRDIACTPLVMAFALIEQAQTTCFLDPEKASPEVVAHLAASDVKLRPYDEVHAAIQSLPAGTTLLFDPKGTSVWLEAAVPEGCHSRRKPDPIELMKACKQPSELAHMRQSSLRDCAFLAQLFCWIDEQLAANRPLSECAVIDKLEQIRSASDLYLGPSFHTIAAYGSNAALMHYRALPGQDAAILPSGFLLVDAGGQYRDGTTDITRTHACGPLTPEQQRDFTLVLKGHIALARAVFLEGTTGSQLDALARQPLAREGLDYRCGTGHGLGFCACVHEGPHSVSPRHNPVPLKPGMVLTDEPGVYREGCHGIRIENTLAVTDYRHTDCGLFYAFEVLSYFPIDMRPVLMELLTRDEIDWLRAYQATCLERLLPVLDPATARWLESFTR